ncbi:hypothetical protein AWA2013_32760 (plasmid) [Lactiplantibacillus plantarum]|nr:hypothetical protein AWA2013_32760 [Lactiplantibacillus plantarum]
MGLVFLGFDLDLDLELANNLLLDSIEEEIKINVNYKCIAVFAIRFFYALTFETKIKLEEGKQTLFFLPNGE